MRDLWGFFLQTLTASGAAVLLLAAKGLFRDKLPPQWQFSVWGLLGVVLVVPAGLWGRYVLVDWPWLVETVKTLLTGDYGLTRVTAPIPLLPAQLPQTPAQWLFCLYLAGVLGSLGRYGCAYIRLRAALRQGIPAKQEQVERVAAQYGLPVCRTIEVSGIPSALVCGVLHPVLVLPAGQDVDDKVLLHELLHLKQRDTLWGMVICVFRCIHWCNPLLQYCAGRAANDLESRCDQRVLERLEGEERREYGGILLSMTNEKYARVPGASSMANGGRNIRRRIEAIVRFKRYPAGMTLAAVCVAVLLSAPLLLGTQARSVYDIHEGSRLPSGMELEAAMASARTVRCTTLAGALDTYGKALLKQSCVYRAMCAPLEQQAALGAGGALAVQRSEWPEGSWNTGLPAAPDPEDGYFLYNVEPVDGDAYEAVVGVRLRYPPEGQPEKEHFVWLAWQTVQAERQDGRWVVLPLGAFETAEIPEVFGWVNWGCEVLPAYVYTAQAEGIRVETRLQKGFEVYNTVQETTDRSWFTGPSYRFDTVPKPDARFSRVYWNQDTRCIYVGDADRQEELWELGVSIAPMEAGAERPELLRPSSHSSGSSSSGADWGGQQLEPGWGPEVRMSGGGSANGYDETTSFALPDQYAADLYLNGEKRAELALRMTEGGAQ